MVTRLVARLGMIGLMVALVGSLMAAIGPQSASAASFDVGDIVKVIDGELNLRVAPSLTAKIDRVLPDGTELEILDSPTSAAGFSWYKVQTEDARVGWVAGLYLADADSSGGTVEFSADDTVRVVGGSLNVRSKAGLDGSIQDVLDDGAALSVMEGPVVANGYTWYKVRNFGIVPGWVAGEFLVYDDGISMCEGQGPCDDPKQAGDIVRVVTDRLNLRAQPGTSATVLDVLENGAVGEFTGDTQSANGMSWIKITGDFGTGWVARQYVAFD